MLLHEADLHTDLDVTGEQPALEDFGELIEHVDGYLCEIKDLQVRDGLHVLGQAPQGDQLRGLLAAIMRLQGLHDAVAASLALDAGEPRHGDAMHDAVVAALEHGSEDPRVAERLRFASDEVVPKLLATANEIPALLGGLHGRFVPAGPSGSPTRGRPDALPTGRNMYSVDPRALPCELAYETGVRLAGPPLGRPVPE